MTLRRLRRLEERLSGTLKSFVLEDDSRHYYDPTSGERFLHAMGCLKAQHHGRPFPEPPETTKALTRARDRAAAVAMVYEGQNEVCPYDKRAIVENGELMPRSMVAGREPGEPIEDLSEP
jgi:hypothetical protein